MRARHRVNFRSESGAVAPGTVVGVAFAALVIYVLLGATNADPAHYGSVPIPSKSEVTLSKGTVQIYYLAGPGSGAFTLPDNIGFGLSDSAGNPLSTESKGDNPKSTDNGETELVGSVSVPEDGTYTVAVGGVPAADAVSPQLTFGESPFGAIKDRASDVVDKATGPTGILVLGIVVLLVLYSRARETMKKPSH